MQKDEDIARVIKTENTFNHLTSYDNIQPLCIWCNDFVCLTLETGFNTSYVEFSSFSRQLEDVKEELCN